MLNSTRMYEFETKLWENNFKVLYPHHLYTMQACIAHGIHEVFVLSKKADQCKQILSIIREKLNKILRFEITIVLYTNIQNKTWLGFAFALVTFVAIAAAESLFCSFK